MKLLDAWALVYVGMTTILIIGWVFVAIAEFAVKLYKQGKR